MSRRDRQADGLVAGSEPLVLSRELSAEHSTLSMGCGDGAVGNF